MRALAALLLIAMLGVSGCSTTLFESLPTGASTGCDPAWPGRWQPVATEPGERQHPGSVEVSADCRTLTDNAKAKPLHLTLIDTGKARYVEVRSDSGEPDCIGEGKAHCGATLLRYEHEGDTIRLYDPDHAWVATAIASGKLKGHAERGDGDGVKTSEPVYRNFIAGDGKRYKGRGLIQITGRDNYRSCSSALCGDPDILLAHPEMLETVAMACESAAWWWSDHGLNALADAGQFDRITRRINGGTNGAAERNAFYARAKQVLAC